MRMIVSIVFVNLTLSVVILSYYRPSLLFKDVPFLTSSPPPFFFNSYVPVFADFPLNAMLHIAVGPQREYRPGERTSHCDSTYSHDILFEWHWLRLHIKGLNRLAGFNENYRHFYNRLKYLFTMYV